MSDHLLGKIGGGGWEELNSRGLLPDCELRGHGFLLRHREAAEQDLFPGGGDRLDLRVRRGRAGLRRGILRAGELGRGE